MFKSQKKSKSMSVFKNRTRKAKKLIFSYGTVLFMVFSIFSIASLYLMRTNILSNSNAVGREVVQRLDSSLRSEFDKERQFIELIAHYADVFLQEHSHDPDGGRAAFDTWLKQTAKQLAQTQNDIRIDLYASIDGQIVSPTYWDGDAFLVTEARPWYKAAMLQEQGHAAVLDPYTDIFTNTVITTIAARIGNTNNVIALDLYLESASQASIFSNLVPDNYCFYLVDSRGTVILYYTPFNSNYAQIQRYVNSFFETHVKGVNNNTDIDDPITDLIGEKRHIFVAHDEQTGWYTIATTLYSEILFNYHMISNLFLLMVIIFIIIEVWMVWREYHLSSQIETTNEALKVLGNSYQIIMRVNFKQGTFTTLKAPDMMRIRLASRNTFDDLITLFSDIVLPESWNNFYKNFSLNHLRNLASLSIRDFGHDYQLKLNNDTRYRWFNARILFDESLDLDESIICFKLIDEEKITELEEHKLLADALESAKRNEESKNVFFANMSHDMRTPLNGIISLCQIGLVNLKNSRFDNLPDVFKKMTTASHQLLTLVDDILEVARPQMESKLTMAPFDLVYEINEDIDVFKANAAQQGKQVNLIFDINHQIVIGDAPKLRQILNNLVSNSLKYSHPGCVVTVHIREILHLHRPSFIVEVSDTGIGMDKEFLKQLFHPYSREQRMPSVQGTGLGMSIVKNVVNIMGGDIKVKSTVNVGTTFTINLPFRLPDEETANKIAREIEAKQNLSSQEAAEQAVDEQAKALSAVNQALDEGGSATHAQLSPSAKSYMDNFSLSGLHILVVEDNQLNMEIACDILGMKGVKVTSAWDGMQAVDIFSSNEAYTFDAILMDMRMPKMDGCEASSNIRATNKDDAKTIPIIACTANAFTEDIASTQSAGMNAHISKPIDFNVLERILAKAIASRPDFDTFMQKHGSEQSASACADAPDGDNAAASKAAAPDTAPASDASPIADASASQALENGTDASQGKKADSTIDASTKENKDNSPSNSACTSVSSEINSQTCTQDEPKDTAQGTQKSSEAASDDASSMHNDTAQEDYVPVRGLLSPRETEMALKALNDSPTLMVSSDDAITIGHMSDKQSGEIKGFASDLDHPGFVRDKIDTDTILSDSDDVSILSQLVKKPTPSDSSFKHEYNGAQKQRKGFFFRRGKNLNVRSQMPQSSLDK